MSGGDLSNELPTPIRLSLRGRQFRLFLGQSPQQQSPSLEEENRKLKKLLAVSMLDASTLKEMLGKNF